MAFGGTFDAAAPVEVYDQLLPDVQSALRRSLVDGCLVHIVTPNRQRLPGDRSLGSPSSTGGGSGSRSSRLPRSLLKLADPDRLVVGAVVR
jgi:hypothetical protein